MSISPLTVHACQRLEQRTQLSQQQLIWLIDQGLYQNLGSKPGLHKRHLLVYSALDDDYYVVILDPYDGMIITVLTLEYHHNLAWQVSEMDKQMALHKWQTYAHPSLLTDGELPLTRKVVPNLIYLDQDNNYRSSSVSIGKSFRSDSTATMSSVLYQDKVIVSINKKLAKIRPSHLLGISLRLGWNGVPVFFSLEELGFGVSQDNLSIFILENSA